MEALINEDRCWTIWDLALESRLPTASVHLILCHNLCQFKKSCKMGPLPSLGQKQTETSQDWEGLHHKTFQEGQCLHGLHHHNGLSAKEDPEQKRQSAQWLLMSENPPREAKGFRSKKKMVLIAFFDCEGMIYQAYMPKGKRPLTRSTT